ncbi:MAG TPA: DNA-processing protein DprA [Syntrophorhabdales bacterium]|nr:DNA-processing protein DprA [Syntrophorhabdales bacterium]
MEEIVAALALVRIPGVSYERKKEILEGPESVASLFEGKRKIEDPRLRQRIRSFKGFGVIEGELTKLREMDVQIIFMRDAVYPPQLKRIPDPPLALYLKGPLSLHDQMMAIVGSRRATYEGMNLAERIAETLSSLGVTIVSGFARGVDSSAHRGALKGKGKTVAVFGCGIDICYPVENQHLYERVAREGLLLTEYTAGERPLAHHFPARNRIIAGLSKGVLVIEATSKSGSLITARLALEYGREVLAVPGRVFDEEYKGANNLIKQGAKLVEGMEDIITCCFPGLHLEKNERLAMDDDEDYIYSLMGLNKIHVDELAAKSRKDIKHLLALLTRLEMKDLVRPLPGGFYLRKV